MRRKWTLGTAVALAAAVGLGRAADDETYDLRRPAPIKGQIYLSTSVMRVKNADVTVKAAGETVNLKQSMTMTSDEEEKVLAVEGRQVTKSQAKVIKSVVDTVTESDGQKLTDTKKNELDGEVIISERNGEGKWKHALVENKPTDKQKQELDRRLGPENDDDLYPAGKVKVGHTWTVDSAAMKTFFGNSLTDIKGKMKQTFVRVEDVDGESCAVVESTGPIKGKMKYDEGALEVEMELKAMLWRSLKTGIDVKATYAGKIRISGEQKIGEKADFTLEGSLSGESTTKLK